MVRIGYDFNGVVTNSGFTKQRVAKRFFGIELSPSHSVKRELIETMRIEDYYKIQQIAYWTSEFLKTPAMEGALPHIVAQQATGYEVYCISRLDPQGVQFGRQWLAEHDLARNMLVSVGRGGSKAWVLCAGFDVYVDDNATILNGLGKYVPHRFLLSTPYNQNDQLAEGVTRIADWNELAKHLRAIRTQNR